MLSTLQDVLDLIEKPQGIIDLLDEQCKFPRVRSCSEKADFSVETEEKDAQYPLGPCSTCSQTARCHR